MPTLDRTQPYAVVYGDGIYRISQDGHLFSPNGKEVGVEDDTPPQTPVDVINGETHDDRPLSLEDMHWEELKALIESYGMTWTDKAHALQQLRGMGNGLDG